MQAAESATRLDRLTRAEFEPWLSRRMKATVLGETDRVLAQGRYLSDLGEELGNTLSLSGGTIEDLLPPEFVRQAARDAVEAYPHYPGVKGYLDLRYALAEKLRTENGINANPEGQILPMIGLQHVIDAVMRIIVDVDDEVLVFDPEYAGLNPAIQMAGGRVVRVPLALQDGDWSFDPEELIARASRKTKLLAFSNPHNPTGIVFSKRELELIAEIAKALDIWVFCDEEYEKTLFDGAQNTSLASLPGMQARTITGYSFSKPYAMTAYRIGYAVGPSAVMDHMHTIARISAQACSAVGMRAAHAVLTGDMAQWTEQKMSLLNEKRDYMRDRLNAIPGIQCNNPKGVYFTFPEVYRAGLSSYAIAEHALRTGRVAVVPGTQFGPHGEGHLRFSFCPGMATIVEGLDRFERAWASL